MPAQPSRTQRAAPRQPKNRVLEQPANPQARRARIPGAALCLAPLLLVGVVLHSAPLPQEDSVVPGRWELVDALPAGTTLTVTLKMSGTGEAGAILSAALHQSDDNSLTLVNDRGEEIRIARDDIETVSYRGPRWTRGDKIGMSFLVGGSAALAGICYKNMSDKSTGATGCLNWLWILPALALLDPGSPVLHEPEEEVIYRSAPPAPSPWP